jgi:hypothetical protein
MSLENVSEARAKRPYHPGVESAAGARPQLPEGLRKLQQTPTCERCRSLPTALVRGVEGRSVALCASCDWRLKDTARIAARNLSDLTELERQARSGR